MLLGTHSREGLDAWMVLLSFLVLGILEQRERALKD